MPSVLLAALALASAACADVHTIETFAGGGAPPDGVGDGLVATAAALDRPSGLARGPRGLYVAEHDAGRIRRIRMKGRRIVTVAGAGAAGLPFDGIPAMRARLVQPTGVALLRGGLLIAEAGTDAGANAVRRVDARGVIHTFAGVGELPPGNEGNGGPATAARLHTPLRFAVSRGDVYVVELNNHQVRVVRGKTGTIEAVAGTGLPGNDGDDGPATAARLRQPAGLAVAGGVLYVADFGNHRLRAITPDGLIHALAGTGIETGSIDGEGGDPRDDLGDGGVASAATFARPTGIAVERSGALVVADQGNHRIRRIAPDADGRPGPESVVTTIAGTGEAGFAGDGSDASLARLNLPTDVLPLARGRLLVADRGNDRVRLVVPVR